MPSVNRSITISTAIKNAAELFLAKNADYGASYLKTGEIAKLILGDSPALSDPGKHAELGLLTRMLDKVIRVANLRFVAKTQQVNDESAVQTLRDLGVYAFMWADLIENKVENAK